LHPKVPRENNHPLAQSITTIFTGVYRAMIRLITRFGESLYREVCLLYRNLPEGDEGIHREVSVVQAHLHISVDMHALIFFKTWKAPYILR
jgi:hypothetical protein